MPIMSFMSSCEDTLIWFFDQRKYEHCCEPSKCNENDTKWNPNNFSKHFGTICETQAGIGIYKIERQDFEN